MTGAVFRRPWDERLSRPRRYAPPAPTVVARPGLPAVRGEQRGGWVRTWTGAPGPWGPPSQWRRGFQHGPVSLDGGWSGASAARSVSITGAGAGAGLTFSTGGATASAELIFTGKSAESGGF